MSPRHLILLLAWTLAACEPLDRGAPRRAEAPADTTEGAVRFRLVGPNETALVVPVHLNGRGPFDFVFDTGATLTCVDEALAEQLALEERPQTPGYGVGIGSAGPLRIVGLDSMRIGAARAEDLIGCVVDLGQMQALGVQGLVGLNFMKPFRVTLDFERQELRLHQP